METTLADLARLVHGAVVGDGSVPIRGCNGLREAGPGEIAFLANAKYGSLLRQTRAAAVIVTREISEGLGPASGAAGGSAPVTGGSASGIAAAPPGGGPGGNDAAPAGRGRAALLVVDNPSWAFAQAMSHFAPAPPRPPAGIHPSAVVAADAKVHPDATVMARATVGAGSEIGAGCVLHPGVSVGVRVAVGPDSVLHPHVVIYDGVTLGARVIVHGGSVIGCDGFGYATLDGVHHKLPQQGTVVIEDDVEIGANVTIDRARFGRTAIGRGTKIDNLVHIGHNVVVGEHTLIVAQVGIAGSTKVGRGVVLAGQAGVGGHLEIGDQAMIGARAGVTKNVPPGAVVSGYPARAHGQSQRILAATLRLPRLHRTVQRLQKRLERLIARIEELENEPADDRQAR